jgi:hypothetical protein
MLSGQFIRHACVFSYSMGLVFACCSVRASAASPAGPEVWLVSTRGAPCVRCG